MNRSIASITSGLQHPFWPVTGLSGLLAAAAAPLLLVWYIQTRHWPHLALSGLALIVAGAHAVAWWLARRRGAYSTGLWVIVGAQVFSALAAPLFMADYWVIGLFLLAAVPLEVGAADHLRRIPFTVVYVLLAAAGMAGIDLAAGTDRLTLLATAPGGVALAGLLFGMQLAGMAWLLWRLRLRPGAPFFVRPDLATQQTLVFTSVSAAFIVLVTAVLIVQIRNTQVEQVGRNFQTLAEINAERAGNALEDQLEALSSLGRIQSVIQLGLETANSSYPEDQAAVRDLLAAREQLWQSSADISEFVLRYRNNPQTIELSRFRGTDLLHSNVFLTDRYGALVAAQGRRPDHFYYGDTDWWQAAWNNSQGGAYLGQLTLDLQTKRTTVFMAVRVLNPQTNATVGVLASTYDLAAIQNGISQAARQSTAEVILLAADGRLMAGPSAIEIGQPAWSDMDAAGLPPLDGAHASPGPASAWAMGLDRAGRPAVLAHAPLITTSGINETLIQSLGWRVVVSDTQANGLAGVTRSTKVAVLVGVLAMALGVLAATGTAQVITRPIEALTTTAAAITAGNLEQRAEPVGPVELVTLAEAFNTLTGQLRSLINNLQDQVRQRTAQVEARAEQLATLNRITQAVTSVRDLRAALALVAREMVQLFDADSTGIALLNPARTELTVVAEHYRDNRRAPVVGVVIPVTGNPSSQQVIETRKPLFVGRAQQNPLTSTIHELMQARETQGLMIVPLLARGEVIGTFGVSTRDPQREFSEAELGLAETIAGHIAGAIDNVRLYEQMAADKQRLELLYDLGQNLSARLDLEQVYATIHRDVAQLIPSDAFIVARLNEDETGVTLVYLVENGRRAVGRHLDLGQGLSGQVIATGEPIWVPDLGAGGSVLSAEVAAARSALAVPLWQGRKAVGALVTLSFRPAAYGGEDLQTLGALALQATIAIENARLFDETKQARAAAEAANEAKSTFLANVSHELRTPLTSVLGFARIIQRRLEARVLPAVRLAPEDRRTQRAVDQVRANIEIIIAEGERLTALINDVLDLAKIEAGRVEWQMAPLNVVELIDRALAATAALFEQKRLVMHRVVPANLPWIQGDRDRLIQVVINLLSNAVKFTEHGSVTCQAEQVGQMIVISVIDTGIGIAAADRPKLFGKFMQVSDTQAGKPRGTGLGLSISQQIVEHHGGRLWVTSEPGQGSTFAFSLPIPPAPAAAAAGSGDQQSQPAVAGDRSGVPEAPTGAGLSGAQVGSRAGLPKEMSPEMAPNQPVPETGEAGGATLSVPADIRYLVVVRQFVEEAAQGLAVTPRAIDDLVQAADEISANIILHGYRGRPGQIEVDVRPEDDGVAVVLRDQAPPFDPTLVPEPDLSLPLDKRPLGGLGIYLSRRLTDELRHRLTPGGGNEVILIKRGVRAAQGGPTKEKLE